MRKRRRLFIALVALLLCVSFLLWAREQRWLAADEAAETDASLSGTVDARLRRHFAQTLLIINFNTPFYQVSAETKALPCVLCDSQLQYAQNIPYLLDIYEPVFEHIAFYGPPPNASLSEGHAHNFHFARLRHTLWTLQFDDRSKNISLHCPRDNDRGYFNQVVLQHAMTHNRDVEGALHRFSVCPATHCLPQRLSVL